jgi:hypothetical protein
MEQVSWYELDELRVNALHVPFGPQQQLEKMLAISMTARRTFPGGQEPASIPMPLVLVPPRLLPDVLALLQQRVAEDFPGLQGAAATPATPGATH